MEISNVSAAPNGIGGRRYIRHDSNVEQIPANEAEDVQAVADMINTAQGSI